MLTRTAERSEFIKYTAIRWWAAQSHDSDVYIVSVDINVINNDLFNYVIKMRQWQR